MGSKALRGRFVEKIAPTKDPMKAMIAIGIVALTSAGIFL